MSTILELFDISRNGITKCDVPLTQPLFEAFPNELVIDEYDAFGTYEYTIRFRNRDSVPRRLRVLHPDPMHFAIKQSPRFASRKTSSRVASGMTIEYIITFTPEERREYECDLMIETERERFTIPIRAKGHPIKLQYPDTIHYDEIPVNFDNNKMILLRNVGKKSTRWQIYSDDTSKSILSFQPFEGLLDPNDFINIGVKFHPNTVGEYHEIVTLEHQDGKERIEVIANAQNIKLQLSKGAIHPSPAYINLSSQSLFRFYNRSETPFTFHTTCTNTINWSIEPQQGEIYPNGFIEFVVTFLPKESKIYRDTLCIDCKGRDEPIPIQLEGTGIGPKAMFSFDTLDIGEIFLSAVHKYTVSLHNIGDIAGVFNIKMSTKDIQKHQLEVDISPSSGTLEVGQVLEIVITLSGYQFGHFTLPISCHFQGTDPLSLKLQGEIIAPKLEFDVEKLEFGTVSYGFENAQIVSLHNDSDIPVKFKASIPSDESKREFKIKLYDVTAEENNNNDDADQKININNHGTFDGYNFNGCIYPRSSINLQVLFKSVSVKKYKDYNIMIDVDNVSDGYLSLPVSAHCVVPAIEIEEKEIDLKDTYLKYEYSGTITIRNDSELPVTFQFIPQNDKTKQIAIIGFDEPIAILNANTKKSLKYHFYAQKLGESTISCYISVVGSTAAPLQTKFHFVGIGPKLRLSLKDEENNHEEDRLSEIHFGNISALKKHSKVLLIENIGPIPASLHAEVRKTNSCYNINVDDVVIKPDEILPITVDVFLNDTVKVTDDLMITVLDANEDIAVSLFSRGVGTTLVPSVDMKLIDFLNQFTNNKCSKSLRIENRGKRAQTIVWNYVKRKEEIIESVEVQNENENDGNISQDGDTQSEMSFGGKSFASVGSNATSIAIGGSKYKSNALGDDEEDDDGSVPSIFKITPSKITLQPNTAVDFKLIAKSTEEGVITELWECGVFVGKARKAITVFKPELRCNFLKPLIEFSHKKLYFEYLYEENVLIKPLTKPLKLKNISLLPLVFMIKCPIPFSVDRLEYTLNPNQETTVHVSFDPGMKTDRLCYRPKARLSIIYRDHPQRDKIPLYAECWFPNLQFPSTNIAFGCIRNYTKNVKHITVQNISKVDVEFSWVFLQDEFEDMEPSMIPLDKRHFWVQSNKAKSKERERRNSLIQMTRKFDMSDLFDIRPLHGMIKAQQSVQMSFVFNGKPNIKAFGTALCEVSGGPEYYLQLTGSTNEIVYDISTSSIEFGTNSMGQTVSDEVIISNTSGVPFEFNINTASLKNSEFIQINPIQGVVAGCSKQKISIKCTPLLPIRYKEEFQIQIAYFTPQTITLTLDAFCTEIIVDLPRDITPDMQQNEAYQALCNAAKTNVNHCLQRMYDSYRQHMMQSDQKDESPRSEEPSTMDVDADNNYINREIDKLQYIDVLSNLLTNYWTNRVKDNQNKQKSKKITFSTKDLKIAYDESNLVTVSQEVNNNFNIHQHKSLGSIRYRSFELLVGFYLLSFGNVIHSLSYTKTFTLRNQDLFHYFKHQIMRNNNDFNSSLPPQQSLIVEYDKQFLSNTPFHIEPNKSIKLTPKSSFDFVVTYNPNKKVKKSNKNGSMGIGAQKFSIPFRVGSGGGPCFCLNVEIDTRVPNIEIQSSLCDAIQNGESCLDFGDVLMGQCKDVYIRLINNEKVDCEWKFDTLSDKKSTSSTNNKQSTNQASQFWIEPKTGKLAPKQFVDVKIRYTPMKSGVTNIKFPLSVLHNEQMKSINIKANGIRKTIQMEPRSLTFEAVLPSTASEPIPFKITNEGHSDVTVYSLDFDEQYTNEEALLSSVKWPSNNKILVSPSITSTTQLKDVLKEQSLLNNEEEKEKEAMQTTSVIALIHDPFYDTDALTLLCQQNEIVYITLDEMKESVLSMSGDQVNESQRELLETVQQNIEEYNDTAYRYLTDMMTLFLYSVKLPLYCILDVSGCITVDPSASESEDDTATQWLTALKALANHTLVSHFGIGYIASDDIDTIRERFDTLRTEWSELLPDIPFDEFEGTSEYFENELQQYELSMEEYESLLSQQSDVNERTEIALRIQQREALRKQYIPSETFNHILSTMAVYHKYWSDPNLIQLHSAALTHHELLGYVKNDSIDDARFRAPIPLPQTHQILLKPRVSNDKCKITDYIQLYCKVNPDESEVESETGTEVENDDEAHDVLSGYHKLDLKARFTIKASSQMEFCVVFQSDICQQLEKYLRFSILGCKDIFKLSFNAVCALPDFDSTPKSLFSSLIATSKATTHKKYVESDELYEFGALLAGIDPEMRHELPSIIQELESQVTSENDKILEEEERSAKKKQLGQLQKRWKTLQKMYSESIHITNDGEFDLNLEFEWENPSTAYFIEPTTLEIMKGESKTFKIWCFPTISGILTDILQCQIANNPNPMKLKFRCRGCVPKIELSTNNIDFDRQICGTDTLQQTIVLKNTSLVSAKWNISQSQLDTMPKEFKFSKTNGNIPANKKDSICVSFSPSDVEKQISYAVHLNVLDTRSIKETDTVQQQHFSNEEIQMSAESFKMLPQIDIANSHLDFGVVKVNSKSIQKFTIQNNGKYALKFKLISSGKAAIRKLVKSSLMIMPSSGSIDAKDEVEIVLVFQSKIEIEPLQKIQALKLHIIEDTKDCVYESIPIRISVSCVYAKFHTVPQSTINLGSVELLKTRTKSLELYNDGDFDLEYEIVTSLEQLELKNKFALKHNQDEDGENESDDEKKQQAMSAENEENKLMIGRYIIDPSKGVVPKQGYKSISITLDAQELKSFKETIYLFIKHCSPFQPKLCFELTGESCSPGIDTHDFRNIFEEQSVVIQAPNNPYALTQNTFVVEDRAFLFTPIILKHAEDTRNKAAAAADSAGTEHEIAERFKITNPFNVPCDVNFSIEPRMGPAPCPFTLKQGTMHLSPHEYKYISCDFVPTNLDYYSAIFKAEVVDGQDEQTKQLTFELRGRGILPRLSIVSNLANDELSRKVIEMGRVFVNQSSNHSFTISNHGIINAKYCYELQAKNNNVYQMFSAMTTDSESATNKLIDVRSKEFVLTPNTTQTVNVKFHPTEAGDYSLLITLNIDANPFESTTIVCKGIAYRQDITIFSPDLSVETVTTKKGTTDLHRSLNFNDLAVGSVRRKQVTLTNHSHYLYRFVANLASECITIRPNIGHILPDSSRILLLTLHAKQRAEIKETLAVALEQIKYENDKEEIMEWDNTMTQFRNDVKESVTEPNYEVVCAGDPNELLMDILAVSDEGRYECDVSEIKFDDTAMLQTSKYEFELSNVSSVSLEYFWNITTFNNNDEVKSAFQIAPNIGSIPPKTKQVFNISFAPQTPGQYQCELQATITPLNEEQSASPLLIPMSGKSTRPICHFDYADYVYSEYITCGIRKASQTGPNGKIGESLAPNIRVLQSKSLGIQVRNKLSFVVLNTLDQSYNFLWKPQRVPNCFRCLTPSGEILPCNKCVMSFEYKPKKSEVMESFWEFHIDSHKYIVPFLIVGSVFEPDVRLSHSNIKFLPQLVGTCSQQVVHIENTENTAFEWWIDRNAFLKSIAKYRLSSSSENEKDAPKPYKVHQNHIPLIISTYSGVIEANSSFNIELTFKPLRELQYNFNIAFHVRNKPGITMLNVKGEGFMIHPEIEFIDDKTILNLQPKRLTPINFGNIHIKQSKHKKFIIYNKSNKYPFEFNWKFLWPTEVSISNKKKYQNELLRQCLTITPGQGTIAPQHEIECELTFKSLSQISIDQQKLLTLEIGKNKYKNYLYPFSISAKARKPRIEFLPSTCVSFGDCFLYHANSEPLRQQFTIKNKEVIGSITVDVMFDSQPHLEVSPTGSIVVESQKQVEIEVTFRPRQTKLYCEKILLDINGLFTSEVIVKGKGIDLKVDVEDESQRSISFGNLRVGQTRTKKLSLINKSKKITTCSISLDHILSTKYIAVDPVPLEKFRLRKNEKKYISLTFDPPIRLAPFEGNLLVNAEGQSCILSRIRGGCHGIGAKLDSDTLSFGTVVAGSSKKMAIKLCNTGDVGVKFRWDTKPIKPHFSLQPVMGYIEENGYILIQVLFRPKAVKQNIRINRVPCYIEGDASIQYLSLIGSCMNQPTGETYELSMDTKVRTITTADITIKNNTNEDWELHPVIQNDYWVGPNKVHVKKHSEYKYVIQYRPLLMTWHTAHHNGSIFFPLPNGTAILYNLIGTASSPDIENEIDITTPAKQNKTITLSVKNWLNKRQRFHVQITQKDHKESVFINGVEWIDIPGLHNRNYRLVFYSLKQGDPITFYIKFVNEKINEFIQYKVNVCVTQVTIDLHPLASASGYSDQVITMQSTVRNRLAYQLSINNPLRTNRAVISKFKCDSNHIYIPHLPFELPSDSQKRLTIYYRPLCRETKKESILSLYSDELGEYKYLLKLTSTPVGIDKILKFNSFLGGEDLQTFRFLHYSAPTTYDVKITTSSASDAAAAASNGDNDFCVAEKQLKVANGSDDDNNADESGIAVSIDITYTPSNIGNVRNLLIISSSANDSGATYQCALHGFCDPPKPKGPYQISSNKPSLQIPFQNPYRENCQFAFQTDNNCFVLKKQSEIIKPKHKIMIDVQFKISSNNNNEKSNGNGNDNKSDIMGKLIIKSKNKHEWVYYIRGVIAP